MWYCSATVGCSRLFAIDISGSRFLQRGVSLDALAPAQGDLGSPEAWVVARSWSQASVGTCSEEVVRWIQGGVGCEGLTGPESSHSSPGTAREWARPLLRSPRKTWRAITTFCRQARSWRTLFDVSICSYMSLKLPFLFTRTSVSQDVHWRFM